MQKVYQISFFFFILTFPLKSGAQDSLTVHGQLSGWMLYNTGNDLHSYLGGRYIPQLNYSTELKEQHKIDFEASVNMNGNAGFNPFDTIRFSGQLKPYRFWARYSSQQFEIRAGLQKINFGSASLLRPLMWFDQVDPRDPLKLTDGVWGILARYYFLNNANIWLWGLYGNNNPRGWEWAGTNSRFPEAGGRIQIPVPAGEAALTYHHRVAETRSMGELVPSFSKIPEDRLGFDIKLDLIAGIWLEGTWVHKDKDLGILTNQEILNIGADYTFGAGNGLYVIFEQLIASNDKKPFEFENTTSFSLLSVSYPLSLFDNISGIVYYDWKNSNSYNFLNWQRQFNNVTLYFIGYWNPDRYNIPTQGEGQNLFAGKGIQLMLVWNH
jgi:hypothetical protein